jgi:glc operon protein GlcG
MKRGSCFLGFLLLTITMLLLMSPMLMAQSGKLAEFTISGDAAKAALTTMEISVEAAEKLAKAAVAFASEQGHPVCIAIVGLGGNLVYAYRMNGMLPVNMDTAIYKAESALYFRVSTKSVKNRYSTATVDQRIMLKKYLVEGGLPIIVEGQMIGAIGCGGWYENDERTAYNALIRAIGPQPPYVENK